MKPGPERFRKQSMHNPRIRSVIHEQTPFDDSFNDRDTHGVTPATSVNSNGSNSKPTAYWRSLIKGG
jgi:hypothetical protein